MDYHCSVIEDSIRTIIGLLPLQDIKDLLHAIHRMQSISWNSGNFNPFLTDLGLVLISTIHDRLRSSNGLINSSTSSNIVYNSPHPHPNSSQIEIIMSSSLEMSWDREDFIDIIRILSTLISPICQHINNLRKHVIHNLEAINRDSNDKSHQNIEYPLGKVLDEFGSSIMLQITCKILLHAIHHNIIDEIGQDAVNKQSIPSDVSTNQRDRRNESIINNYRMIEGNILNVHDSCLAISCYQVLSRYSMRYYHLSKRCIAMSWYLFRSVYTSSMFEDIIPFKRSHDDPMRFKSKYSQSIIDLYDNIRSLRDIPIDINRFKEAFSYVCHTYKISPKDHKELNNSRAKTSDVLIMDGSMNMSMTKKYFLFQWFLHETNESRTNGMAFLLKEFFQSIQTHDFNRSISLDDGISSTTYEDMSMISDRIETNRNTNQSSPRERNRLQSNKRSATGRKKGTFPSVISPSKKSNDRMKDVSLDSFGLSFVFFPIILLSSQSKPPTLSETKDNPDSKSMELPKSVMNISDAKIDRMSPYHQYIYTMKMFLWSIYQIGQILDMTIDIDEKLSNHMITYYIKTSRIMIKAFMVVMNDITAWRSQQRLSFENYDKQDHQIPRKNDWGNVSYLDEVIEWFTQTVDSMIELCIQFQDIRDKKGRNKNKIFNRNVSSMNKSLMILERQLSRGKDTIGKYVASNQLKSSYESQVRAMINSLKDSWDDDMKTNVSSFVRQVSSTLQQPATFDMSDMKALDDQLSNQKNSFSYEIDIEDTGILGNGDDEGLFESDSDQENDFQEDNFHVRNVDDSLEEGWQIYQDDMGSLY